MILDRTFSSLDAAATDISNLILKEVTGYGLCLPRIIVRALVDALFKGGMDVVRAWKQITGPKLVVCPAES